MACEPLTMKRKFPAILLAVVALSAIAGCSSSEDTKQQVSLDDTRLNQIQLVGTHNSYHMAMPAALFAAEKGAIAGMGDAAKGLGNPDSLNYGHKRLTDQLNAGIRTFELDVWADSKGGLFSKPLAPGFLKVDGIAPPQGLDQPGFKVLHIVDIDYFSTCPTLVSCLSEIRTWSDAHPNHLPIVIMLELKDEPLPKPINITRVEKIGAPEMDRLDAEIRSVLSPQRMIVPDDVRGSADTLQQAVTTNGWPTLRESRGKLMFFMDNAGAYRTDYLQGHDSLAGRVLFTSAGEGQADAAVLKENDPADGAKIKSLVEAGYFVRTRADDDPATIGADSTAQRDIALTSGAQVVSTDYPVNEPHSSGYVAKIGDQLQARCNPVAVTDRCVAGELERP